MTANHEMFALKLSWDVTYVSSFHSGFHLLYLIPQIIAG